MTDRIPKSEWETPEMWRKQIERQLYEIGTLARGQVPTVSARLADLVEQIDEVRKELEALTERVDAMKTWILANVKKNGGDK